MTSYQITASGSPAPTFSITSGTPPTGVTLSSAGLLSGTPTQAGAFNFTIDATNGVSPDGTQSFTLTVVTQATFTEPFNQSPAHGWTWTQTACSGTCTSTPSTTSTNCATTGGTANECVSATNSLTFSFATAMTGYFHNPTYSWHTVGVPTGATVTSVQGSFYDKIVQSGGNCTTAQAGLAIYDSTNAVELTSSDLVPLTSVIGDTGASGATHSGATLNVTSNQAAASGITIRFTLDPAAAGAVESSSCAIFGDNVNLIINYTTGAGTRRKGQVIIGMNRQIDGTMTQTYAYNVEPLDPLAQPVQLSDLKFVRDGIRGVVLDPSSITDDRLRVTPINLAKD